MRGTVVGPVAAVDIKDSLSPMGRMAASSVANHKDTRMAQAKLKLSDLHARRQVIESSA
jgi:hypothetical protein